MAEGKTRLGELSGLPWRELGALLVQAQGVLEAWGTAVVGEIEEEVMRRIEVVRQSQVCARTAGLSSEGGHGRVEG